jgi:hypothetical protein
MKNIRPQAIILLLLVRLPAMGGENTMPLLRLQEVQVVGSDSDFIRIAEVAVDARGGIFITDGLQFVVRKFTPDGGRAAEYGRRGSAPGEFSAYPSQMVVERDTLFLVEKASSSVKMYTTGFRYLGAIECGYPIVDIAVDRESRVWVNRIVHGAQPKIALYSPQGKELGGLPYHPSQEGDAFQMIHLAVHPRGLLIAAHRFSNLVEVYDRAGRLKSQFHVRGIPDLSVLVPSPMKELGSLPETELIKDLTVDPAGRLYLLGGEKTEPANRKVLVYHPSGKYVGEFLLPAQSGIIHFDGNGFLYTRENQRTVVKKYKVHYLRNVPYEE